MRTDEATVPSNTAPLMLTSPVTTSSSLSVPGTGGPTLVCTRLTKKVVPVFQVWSRAFSTPTGGAAELSPGLMVPSAGPAVPPTLPTAPFNETHWHNDRYDSLYSQAIATVDDSLRTELAHEMQRIDYTEGGYIIPFFPPVIDGYGSNVNGLVPSKGGLSLNSYDFKQLWLS